LVARAASTREPLLRRRLYDDAQRILTEQDVPIIPLFIASQNYLVSPRLRGLKLNAMEILTLKDVSIAGEAPGEDPGAALKAVPKAAR